MSGEFSHGTKPFRVGIRFPLDFDLILEQIAQTGHRDDGPGDSLPPTDRNGPGEHDLPPIEQHGAGEHGNDLPPGPTEPHGPGEPDLPPTEQNDGLGDEQREQPGPGPGQQQQSRARQQQRQRLPGGPECSARRRPALLVLPLGGCVAQDSAL
eukprot:Skav214207  [mRNA]  locus=scaffold489:186802:191070:- [translate_table: standard]